MVVCAFAVLHAGVQAVGSRQEHLLVEVSVVSGEHAHSLSTHNAWLQNTKIEGGSDSPWVII